MFASGVLRHQAPSTPSPNAVSAAPSGRGLAAGSRVVTPRATVSPASGAGAGDPQPTAARAAAAITTLPASGAGPPPPQPTAARAAAAITTLPASLRAGHRVMTRLWGPRRGSGG